MIVAFRSAKVESKSKGFTEHKTTIFVMRSINHSRSVRAHSELRVKSKDFASVLPELQDATSMTIEIQRLAIHHHALH